MGSSIVVAFDILEVEVLEIYQDISDSYLQLKLSLD